MSLDPLSASAAAPSVTPACSDTTAGPLDCRAGTIPQWAAHRLPISAHTYPAAAGWRLAIQNNASAALHFH